MTAVHRKIRGIVKRVLSLGAGGGAILVLQTGHLQSVRVVISHDKLSERLYVGEILTVFGRYEMHPVYEKQLHASFVHAERPSAHELAGLLGNHPLFTTMTSRRVRRYVRKDGRTLLYALDTDDVGRLLEFGMELEEAVCVVEQWRRYWAEKRLSELLVSGGLKPTRAHDILRIYGNAADSTVKRDPFTLVPFYPWKLVDGFAAAIQDKAANPISRMIGAAEAVVLELQKQGHFVASREEVCYKLRGFLDSTLPSKAIDAAVSAGRLVSWKSSNGEMIQSIGIRILFRKLLSRLTDFSTSYLNTQVASKGAGEERTAPTPFEQLELPCTTSEAIAARGNQSERTLHIVPNLVQRDAINAEDGGSAITYNEVLARLPLPTRKSYRTVILHNCEGLDPLLLSKVLHRLPLGGQIRLCFSRHGPPEILRTLEAMNEPLPKNFCVFNHKLSGLLCSPSDGMAALAQSLLDGDILPIASVQPGDTVLSGASVMVCRTATDFFNEVCSAFYAGRSDGRTVIVTESANDRQRFNTYLHNDWVAYLTQSQRKSPHIFLRGHESATLDEPVVCRSHLRRLNILKGSIGRLVDVLENPKVIVHEGRLITLTVSVHFETMGTTMLSTEEATTLSLAYALPLQLLQLAEWRHIVAALGHTDSIESDLGRSLSAVARRSVLFIRCVESHQSELPATLSSRDGDA